MFLNRKIWWYTVISQILKRICRELWLTLFSLSNPSFLLAIAFIGGVYAYLFKWRQEPIKIRNHEVSNKEKSIFLGICKWFYSNSSQLMKFSSVAVFTFWLGSMSNTIFWLLGATFTGILFKNSVWKSVQQKRFCRRRILNSNFFANIITFGWIAFLD